MVSLTFDRKCIKNLFAHNLFNLCPLYQVAELRKFRDQVFKSIPVKEEQVQGSRFRASVTPLLMALEYRVDCYYICRKSKCSI